MKIDKVTYQKPFVIGPYLQDKVGFEATLDEGEDPKEALSALKAIAEEWHKESNPGLIVEMQSGVLAELQVERGNPQFALENDINSCQEIKVLETYKLLVRGNEYLQKAYEKKFAELKK